jgi:hypothetical protein
MEHNYEMIEDLNHKPNKVCDQLEPQEVHLKTKILKAIKDIFGFKLAKEGSSASKTLKTPLQGNDSKIWRNSIRQIANVAAHAMKTSSILVNLIVVFAKFLSNNQPQVDQTASPHESQRQKLAGTLKKAAAFSEAMFERHRQLVKLVNSATGKPEFDLDHFSEFAQAVADRSRQELESQGAFVTQVTADLGLKGHTSQQKFN